MQLKNVTLIDVEVDGKKSFGLLGPDGRRIAAFDAFAKSQSGRPINTRSAYCRNLAKFFDYLFEAAAKLADARATLTREELVEVLEAYREYLVFGGMSGNELASKVNSTLPSPMVSKASCDSMHAPIRRFLKLSETLRKQLEELVRHRLVEATVDPFPLLPSSTARQLQAHQAAAMVAASMFAGIVSGGPKLIDEASLPSVGGAAPYDSKRAFPFDAVAALINAMPSWRDKALYSFCAASGCRISEALQLLWPDISMQQATVKLVDPAHRANDASYLYLTPKERDKLVWKGRTSQATLLIEPFASMFFEALENYLKNEYFPHGLHQFVFQHRRSGMEGRPYFLSAASSRNGIFGSAVATVRPITQLNEDFGAHSLRHMYGTYLLNYFPRSDGSYGLPIGLVKQLMGHANIKSTERYARHDVELFQAELAYANFMLFGSGATKTLNQMRREVLQAKLAIVERAIAQEATAIEMSTRVSQ